MIALSDMSVVELRKQLRIALSHGDKSRADKIKRLLAAKRNATVIHIRDGVQMFPVEPVKHWTDRDD